MKDVPRGRYKDSPLGSAPEFLKNLYRQHDFFADMTKGFGVSYHQLGPKFACDNLEILVRDPEAIKHMLKDNFDNYTKRADDLFWVIVRLWLGDGIFAASHGHGSPDKGQSWIRQRKIAAEIFSR